MLSRCFPPSFRSIWLTVREQITIEDFQDGLHGRYHGYDSDGDVENVKLLTDIWMREGPWSTGHGISWPSAGSRWAYNRRSSRWLFLLILNLHVAPMPPTKFWLNQTYHWEQIRFEDFQDGQLGSHLSWYWKRTILAILNLYVALMPPIKFEFNLHYGWGGDVVWRNSRWLQ